MTTYPGDEAGSKFLYQAELTPNNALELAMSSYYASELDMLNTINTIQARYGIGARIFIMEPYYEQDPEGPAAAPPEGSGDEGGGDRAPEEERAPRPKGRRKKTEEAKDT